VSADTISRSDALRNSAVWACLVLRSDLISTMPVDVFRRVNGVQVEVPKPQVFITPGGKALRWIEFAYSTQFDLDGTGNTVGITKARDGQGLPSLIELQRIEDVTFFGEGPALKGVRIKNVEYDVNEIWHEKQYTMAGVPIGLSPIAHAARSINAHLTAQEFAAEWFSNSTVPGGHLKNTAKVLNKDEAADVKEKFKTSVQSGDVWVSGSDWEYSMLSAKASESQFLETMNASVVDVCRFLRVPADMIDAEIGSTSASVTYANITQRNLQLLIMNLGPAIARREEALSAGLLPQPRYMKFNTNSLLRMDLKSRYEAYKIGVDSRFLPPSRILDLENQPPLTPEEEAEFARLFPTKAPTPAPVEKAQPQTIVNVERGQGTTTLSPKFDISIPVDVTNPEVRIEPTPVVVERGSDLPPVVNVTVEPTPVTVDVTTPEVVVNVGPTPIELTNEVTVDVPAIEVPAAQVVLTQPAKTTTTTTVSRDKNGEIAGSTAITEVTESEI
jgi:HK97 family phage portal protein